MELNYKVNKRHVSLSWLFVIIIFLAGCKEATELSEGPIDIYHLVPPGKVGIWVNFALDSDTIRNGSILYGKLYLEGDSAFKKAASENHFNYVKTFYYYTSHYSQLKIGSGIDTIDIEMRVYEPNLSEGDYKERRESVVIMASFTNKTDRYDTTFILDTTFTIKGR